MGCKTFLTLWLLSRQYSYAGRSSHGIVFTQWDAKRCWLSDCCEDNAALLDIHHMGLCSHNGMQNVADSLIVMKTMQLCWTFITWDSVHTMGCKTLLTLWWTFFTSNCVHTMGSKTLLTVWLLRRQFSYAWRSSYVILLTQWDAKRCWLSDC